MKSISKYREVAHSQLRKCEHIAEVAIRGVHAETKEGVHQLAEYICGTVSTVHTTTGRMCILASLISSAWDCQSTIVGMRDWRIWRSVLINRQNSSCEDCVCPSQKLVC